MVRDDNFMVRDGSKLSLHPIYVLTSRMSSIWSCGFFIRIMCRS
jgi:hypothetical protein